MCEIRAIGTFTVAVKILSDNSRDGYGHAYEAVVVDADPYDVKPGQAAFGRSPWASIASTALLEPRDRPDPWFYGLQLPEELFLLV